jgi:hypothetical protein
MLHKAKQILEGTIADIRDEAKYQMFKHKAKNTTLGDMAQDPSKNIPSVDDLRVSNKISLNARRENLKRDAKTAAGAVALGIASYKALALVKKRRLHNKWKQVGCDKLTDSVERAKCKQYIASIS